MNNNNNAKTRDLISYAHHKGLRPSAFLPLIFLFLILIFFPTSCNINSYRDSFTKQCQYNGETSFEGVLALLEWNSDQVRNVSSSLTFHSTKILLIEWCMSLCPSRQFAFYFFLFCISIQINPTPSEYNKETSEFAYYSNAHKKIWMYIKHFNKQIIKLNEL